MPDTKTIITELVTGLGMLGYDDVGKAIDARPKAMASVSPQMWEDLERWSCAPMWSHEFAAAFRNGEVFLQAFDALRGRVPVRVDWRGNTKPVDDDLVPADLRIDHVYLVSCKTSAGCSATLRHRGSSMVCCESGRLPSELVGLTRSLRLR